jgi:hypothetical protein
MRAPFASCADPACGVPAKGLLDTQRMQHLLNDDRFGLPSPLTEAASAAPADARTFQSFGALRNLPCADGAMIRAVQEGADRFFGGVKGINGLGAVKCGITSGCAIFGTLFEQALKATRERPALGAHYTDREKILKIVEPVIVRPLMAEWEEAHAEIAAIMEDVRAADAEEKAIRAEAKAEFDVDAKHAKANEPARRKRRAPRRPMPAHSKVSDALFEISRVRTGRLNDWRR